jgi:hypothetical protein
VFDAKFSPCDQADQEAVRAFLGASTEDLRRRGRFDGVERDADQTVAAVFDLLTSQRFGYLGRRKSEPYREAICALMRRNVDQGRPIRFYYDIGPGYHASVRPGSLGLDFEVGLAELVLLRQVVLFCEGVVGIHRPGARFHLVVDNLCGLATNDVPLERTTGYVARLRSLIDAVGASDLIEVLVESELNDWETYRGHLERTPSGAPTDPSGLDAAAIDNVARFLGRSCAADEAARRIDLYARTGPVTEELLEPAIDGVRMTQRASPTTIGFRAFPGGAQRIQVGRLGLLCSGPGKLRPVLLTTRNVDEYEVCEADARASAPIRSVLVARRR